MNVILLSDNQLKLLLKILNNHNDMEFKLNKNIISVDDINKSKIIDIITDYYCKEGLDVRFEPNNLGIELENLLDKFNATN